jgi:hypothetical protein
MASGAPMAEERAWGEGGGGRVHWQRLWQRQLSPHNVVEGADTTMRLAAWLSPGMKDAFGDLRMNCTA